MGAASDIIRKLFAMGLDGKDKEACRAAADSLVQAIVSSFAGGVALAWQARGLRVVSEPS